jgi:hypothetical protein
MQNAPAPEATDNSQPPKLYDDWELDEQLRHIQRVVHGHRRREPAGAAAQEEFARIDAPHIQTSYGSPCRAPHVSISEDGGTLLSTIGWVALSAGMMVFVCGAVLLVWSLFTGRQNLWQLGMPITVAGQVTLLIGLVLQLDRLWSVNRDTAARLHQVDDRLWRLQSSGDANGAESPTPAGPWSGRNPSGPRHSSHGPA